MKHALSENTYLDVKEYLGSRATILVPVGAIEQHGSYLPLGTDAFAAEPSPRIAPSRWDSSSLRSSRSAGHRSTWGGGHDLA